VFIIVHCIALEIYKNGTDSNYWSAAIGRDSSDGLMHIYERHWTADVSYVSQHHSK